MSLGLSPNKALTIEFPDISKKYYKGFIRGYFDGDGSICRYWWKYKQNKKRRYKLLFTLGSLKFLKSIRKILNDEIGVVGKITTRKIDLVYVRVEDISKLYYYLYKDKPNLRIKKKETSFKYALNWSKKQLKKRRKK